MADEAVILNLWGQPKGEPLRYSCASGIGIEKGTLLHLMDASTVTAAKLLSVSTAHDGKPFAGIAATEKSSTDGATTIGVWTKGTFDLKCSGSAQIPNAGELVAVSGGNLIKRALLGDVTGGFIVGRARETASAQETIAVDVGVF